ncbi:Anti-sigma-V factor RsiV [Clostridioides difficile]|nr:Anti-sigma-V factor RsiV [Clostridioides difficile]
MNTYKKLKKSIFKIAVISVCLLVALVNVHPIFAGSSSNKLVKKNQIKVINAKNYSLKQDNYEVNIRVPKIEGLKDKDLENKLNNEFMENGKKLYSEFQNKMKKENNKGHRYLNVSYSVKNNSKDFLSIEVKKEEIEASSYVTKTHYTIDKNREILLNLPIFFKDSRYIDAISDNIKEQMKNQIKKDNTKSYFIDQEKDSPVKNFESINKYQDFYFNKDGNLVISFDEYEVAPGYIGPVEFVIPDKVIKNLK